MRFLQPEILWHLLWILPAMLVISLISWRKTAQTLKSFLSSHADDPDYVLVSKGKRAARFILLCGAVFFLLVAAARPSWGVQIQEMSGQGRDLLFVFDVSKSMLAKDVQPSRLAHAKWLVKELVKLNPGDRFGLIAFAGKGFLECPLTSDKTSFVQTLDELSTESIPVGGTNIQEALTAALQAFKAAETQHRAVVLITDGDELEGNSGKAVDEIVARKIPLFIAGIGDPSQPSIIQVPDGRGGMKTLTDAAGNVVNSPLNEKQLGELAKRTGGIYVRSTAGDPGIGALEKRIRALAPQEYESVKTTKPIDRFSYPLAIAFVLLLIWFVISERSVRRTAGAAALMVLVFLGMPLDAQEQLPAPSQEQTQTPQSAGQTAPAAPEVVSPVESFNRGVEAHEKGDLKNAAGAYEEALRNGVDEVEIRGKATQNLGVITHTKARSELDASMKAVQGQNLDEAQKNVESAIKTLDMAEGMYRDSLRESEQHEALSRNQSILLADRKKAEELKKKIEELKKLQQQTQQQTQQAKNQQQKENQQNKDQQNQQGQQNKDQQNQQGQQNKDQQSQQGQQNKDQQSQQGQQNKDQQSQQGQQNKDQQSQQSQQNKDQQGQQNKDQQSAQQMTEQAKKSAEDLQKKAQEMGQQNLAKSAEQAKKELENAQQEQKQGKGESAEEHLKKALDALGGEQQKDGKDQKQDQSGKDGKDQKQDQKNDQSGKDQNDQDIRQPQQGQAEKKPEEGDIDKAQAASVLEDMAKDEKDLRDAIKAYRKQRFKNATPAKDW